MPESEEPAADTIAAIRALSALHVRFVVIGGAAMVLYGSAHITRDTDFSYSRERENLERLSEVLRGQNARLRGVPDEVPFVLDAQTFRNVQNLTLTTDIGDIDLLATPAGVDSFEGLWDRSVVMPVEDIFVHVASIDDLIAMKKEANRPKDQVHIFELLALQKLIQEQENQHRDASGSET